MEKLSLTALRQKLFQVADQILETGTPVAIERRGKTLLLSLETPPARLPRLKKRSLIQGSPQTLVDEKVWEWREPQNLG